MKIAIFHELDSGGAKRTVFEYSKRLKKTFNVDLYYTGEKKDMDINKYVNKIFYYPFHSKEWKGKNWKTRLYKDTIELINLYKLHKNIAKDIESKKYDFIYVYPSKFTQAPFILRFLKNKYIYYCPEPLRIVYDPAISVNIKNIPFPKNLYEFLNRRIRKWIDLGNFNKTSIVLTNSNYTKEFIGRSYGKKAVVCYSGVDADFFKPQNLNKTIDVLFIGNKDDGYNFLSKMPKIIQNKINVRAIFRESGRVSVSDTELAEIYNKSKVLVALNHNEPFGLIPLEAMACGVPVIAVGEGGYNETIINNKTGYLITRDHYDLYEKINFILGNEDERQRMGKSARSEILKNWTWDKSIERFLAVLSQRTF